MYYIISLKHTSRLDKAITLWRADNCGYCYHQHNAGVYPEFTEGYHNLENDSLPIKTTILHDFFIKESINSESRIIPNCKTVWDALSLKMSKHQLILNKSK